MKKSEVKWRQALRAVKGFIILKISLEMGELYCVKYGDVRGNRAVGNIHGLSQMRGQ